MTILSLGRWILIQKEDGAVLKTERKTFIKLLHYSKVNATKINTSLDRVIM